MKTSFYILTILLILSAHLTSAQDIENTPAPEIEAEKPKVALKDRLFFGGGLGAQFGDFTYINVAPLGGIKITEKFSVGTRLNYSYMSLRYGSYRIKDHIIGGSLFARYFIWQNIYAHTEYESLNGKWDNTRDRFNVNSWFVGGGYLYRLSDHAAIAITGMFNLTPTIYTPYVNPIINVGFTVGL